MNKADLNIHLLPKTLREIADYLSLAVVIRLVDAYGGTRIWVPLSLTPDHELVNLLGISDAQKFCELYAGICLSIDKAEDAIKALRNQDIVRRMKRGEKAKHLARRYHLTERQIWNIQRDWQNLEAESVIQGELW